MSQEGGSLILTIKAIKLQAKRIHNPKTGGLLRMVYHCGEWQNTTGEAAGENLLTIAWNSGEAQTVTIDGVEYVCPAQTLVALMANQRFYFAKPKDIIAWQFNRDFYCIVDHDAEVSCAGLLFYGAAESPLVVLDAEEARKINLLYQVFTDEFDDRDRLQEDMLRMLLKRLIIKATRLYKNQVGLSQLPSEELDILRQYKLLVELHYREWHQVQDYANAMHKSPKTLANLFSEADTPSPLRILHERITLEAKRMLHYTDYSVKEIAYELGFEEVPAFNRLFKKMTGLAPTAFRKSQQEILSGKN